MIDSILAFIARNGRHGLMVGLVVGILAPEAANLVRPLVLPIILFLLFLAVLRIGPAGVLGTWRGAGFWRALRSVLGMQLAAPVLTALVLIAAGLQHSLWGMGLVILLAAAPITGTPHLTLMAGGNPAPALRQLILGTALLPLTVLPVFWLIPAFGNPVEILGASAMLLGAIALSGGLAISLHLTGIVRPGPRVNARIEALGALGLGVVVIGFLSEVGQTLRTDPLYLALVMGVVMAAVFAIQTAAYFLAMRRPEADDAAALTLAAGSRNLALFFGVLPAALVDDLWLMIGCYQIPMYITPLVLRRLILRQRRVAGSG
jgi:arsenite transporter